MTGDLIPCDRWVKRVVASAFDENTAYVGFSGLRTNNEDKTWLFVTKDLGKTWTNISAGMDHAIFDVEEDPDNANVLYLGTDTGVFVTIDQGKTWSAFSTSAPNTVIRDLAIQKRDREMAIGTYGRGFYVVDIGPIKEFSAAVFAEPAHLFDPKATIKWNRYERKGDTLGELARAENPPVGSTLYYYLKADAQKVTVTIKDLEGATIQELTPSAKKGLQKVFWGLNRRRSPASAPAASAPAVAGAGAAGAVRQHGRAGRLQGDADGGRQGSRHQEADREPGSDVQVGTRSDPNPRPRYFAPPARTISTSMVIATTSLTTAPPPRAACCKSGRSPCG